MNDDIKISGACAHLKRNVAVDGNKNYLLTMKKSDGSFILVSVAHCCCRYRGIATEIIIKGERTLLMPCVLPLRIENREELKIQKYKIPVPLLGTTRVLVVRGHI